MTKASTSTQDRSGLRISLIAAIVVIQAVAAVFFIADAAMDLAAGEWGLHIAAEFVIALALVAGVGLGAWQTRRMIEQARRDEQTLKLARGAIADVITQRFSEWGLSDAESEVALFALKGFETGEIAGLRSVAEGTVRAQLTFIYAKAGVGSRHALASLFLDELIEIGPGGPSSQPGQSEIMP